MAPGASGGGVGLGLGGWDEVRVRRGLEAERPESRCVVRDTQVDVPMYEVEEADKSRRSIYQ